MCEIDKHLRDLALEAQKHPQGSLRRQKVMDRLFRDIQSSQKLCRPPIPPSLNGLYGEIYQIAKQELFCYVFKKIDTYNPDRGEVLQWVNFLLSKRFPEAIAEVTHLGKKLSSQKIQRVDLDDLDFLLASRESSPSPDLKGKELYEYIKNDPDGIFHTSHVVGYPQATFQFIALKILEGHSWQDIYQELGVKVSTLSSFYQRNCQKLRPYFYEYLS